MGAGPPRARGAAPRGGWAAAFAELSALAATGALDAAGHERRAVAAYLVGDDDACAAAFEVAHVTALDEGDPDLAARCAFWLALTLLLGGQPAKATGWLARAERTAAGAGPDGAAAGYLLVPRLLGALQGGQPAQARDLARRATSIGVRVADADLIAFSTLGHGQALIALGEVDAGLTCLDEVMVAVSAGDVGPVTTGIVYCAVVLECLRLYDLHRAAEWTAALSAWCDAQPDLVPYRGQCLVHRSQLAQASGDWAMAIQAAQAACARLADPPHPALGLAQYQEAELHRLRGEHELARSEYREASRNGHDPMPGLALLALASGDVAGAAASVRRALLEGDGPARPALLVAAVEVLLAAGDVDEAGAAADELARVAVDRHAPALDAMAGHAGGAVLLARARPAAALRRLREAAAGWQALRMPYEGARTAVLIAAACADLGDAATADLELGNAAAAFADLGARPDLDRLGPSPRRRAGATLSDRETEVLALVAAGRTNAEIAGALAISPHTVGRHLENIFVKLGVANRAAATAWGYEHGALAPPSG